MLKKNWLISFFVLLGFIVCAQEKKEDKLARQFNDAIYALADKKENVRQAAAETLGMLGDRRAVPYLIKSLADKKENVRQAAAKTLGMLGDRRAVPYLIKSLMNGQHYAGMPALEALCRIDENWIRLPEAQAAVSHFINSLHDKDKMVRQAAIEALGKIGDKRAVPHLIKVLNDDANALTTVVALGDLRDKQAVPHLIKLLISPTENMAFYALIWDALRRINKNWAQLPEAKLVVPELIDYLNDKDSYIRGAAAELLGELGDKRAVSHLIKSLKDKDEWVRKAAAEAIERIRTGK